MIDPESLKKLRQEMKERIHADAAILETLRRELRAHLGNPRRIQPRQTTAISLVGADGGNNRIEFDPFMVQLIRVVDSSDNEYCLETITPTSDINDLNSRHINGDGEPISALGKMMDFLGKSSLWELSPMIPKPPREPKPSWLQVYRELTEWAVLFSLIREKDFGTDTVIVCDGLLRSKVFAKDLFIRLIRGFKEEIERHRVKSRRRIYLVGLAKHSKVLQRYRLAMAIERLMHQSYPCFAEVGRELEMKAYVWSEYARGEEVVEGEANKFVGGKMFFAKFGNRPHDPIWPIDLLLSQTKDAQTIFGYLLADAIEGFPVPFYPQCLQRAHENAALVGFDMDILQATIVDAIGSALGEKKGILDELQLVDPDPSAKRYS